MENQECRFRLDINMAEALVLCREADIPYRTEYSALFNSICALISLGEIRVDITPTVNGLFHINMIYPHNEVIMAIPLSAVSVILEYVRPEENIPDENSETTSQEPKELIKIESVLSKDATARFSTADWFRKVNNLIIDIAGCGGIGSWSSLLISRLIPFSINLYDPDRVESVNMAGQFFHKESIGDYKVDVCGLNIRRFSNIYGYHCHRSLYHLSKLPDVLICGFDNMESRKSVFEEWKKACLENSSNRFFLFVDGRLASEKFQIFAMTNNDIDAMRVYERDWLFSDEEADEALCTYKQTSFMASMIASVITNIVVNHASNLAGKNVFPRDVPFLTSYNGPTMYFKVQSWTELE